MSPPQAHSLVTYAITGAIVIAVMAFRWHRTGKATSLKVERLWAFPAILALAVGAVYWTTPPQGFGWLFCLVAAGLGAVLGWQRGRMMRIDVDPDTHRVTQTSSPAALLFILVIVVLRQAARAEGAAFLHLDPLALTDMLLALAFGLVTAQRVEMFLRAAGAIRR